MTTQLVKSNPGRSIRDSNIIKDRVAGMTYKQIAEKHGIHFTRVGQILNDEEVKDILTTATNQLAAFIPLVIDNYHKFLESDDNKTKLEAGRDISKMTGILPTHASNQYFVNIMNQHNQVLITDDMQEFMRWKLEKASRVFNIPSEAEPHE